MDKVQEFIIEKALTCFNNIKFPNEKLLKAFITKKVSIKGTLIVTNMRFSFFPETANEVEQMEHLIFSMVSSLNLNLGDDFGFLDLSYAYDQQRFLFEDKKNIDGLSDILKQLFPNNLEIKYLNQDFITFKNKASQNTSSLLMKDTKPLIQIEDQEQAKKGFKRLIKFAIVFVLISLAIGFSSRIKMVFKYIYLPEVQIKIPNSIRYALNFIYYQQAENQTFAIGSKINENYARTNSFPTDLTAFINSNLKSLVNQNPSLDPWGSLYKLKVETDSFEIISIGPDKKENTSDDFIKSFKKVNISNNHQADL